MVNLIIDHIPVTVPEGTTILQAARSVNIPIPTLCYLEGINNIGACRVCLVEIKGIERLHSSCNTKVAEGMEVFTNSPKVREARRINVEFILSQHDCYCVSCVRSGNCALQTIANDLGILSLQYERDIPTLKWNKSFPLFRNASKCIKCMRCVQVCEKIQKVNIWDLSNTGSRTTVDVTYNRKIEESDCALCGQCITHCPVGALRERDDTKKAFDVIADPDKITVVQIAPAVRTSWGESLGLNRDFATVHRMVSALRKLGFDYIFDTEFSADLTIMEEATEFIKRFSSGELQTMPMFTSCCPGWVRYIKSHYPSLTKYLSSTKSPQQIFGTVAKTYYAKLLGVDPEKIFCVSIMPCIAKKSEAEIPSINGSNVGQDVDLVLTTREITRMIRADHIVAQDLEEDSFDAPLGIGSGAAAIFGATGGVMEAALRSAYYFLTGKNPDPDAFSNIRGYQGWREAEFKINDTTLRVAVASGLGNTKDLIEALLNGSVHYDFVEIMACPGGCSGGGGQPIEEGKELAQERGATLYGFDKIANLRFSHENPSIIKIYDDFLEHPNSEIAHELLHTYHDAWSMPKSPSIER
ncbi:MAG: [FeFe] hydrogenase, group A [Clostridiales bacterium]|nr:[FeFe] hydrogenase, group A [Clostridiales bacterium]